MGKVLGELLVMHDKVIEVMTQGITKIALWMNTCEQLGGIKYIWI